MSARAWESKRSEVIPAGSGWSASRNISPAAATTPRVANSQVRRACIRPSFPFPGSRSPVPSIRHYTSATPGANPHVLPRMIGRHFRLRDTRHVAVKGASTGCEEGHTDFPLPRGSSIFRASQFPYSAPHLRRVAYDQREVAWLVATRPFTSSILRWKNPRDRKSTRLNSSHGYISYAVFCLKKKKKNIYQTYTIIDIKRAIQNTHSNCRQQLTHL